LYILAFTFLGSRSEDKVLDWMVASITWIQSPFDFLQNQIWFVIVVPKEYCYQMCFSS
jgi:hypothetical protein